MHPSALVDKDFSHADCRLIPKGKVTAAPEDNHNPRAAFRESLHQPRRRQVRFSCYSGGGGGDLPPPVAAQKALLTCQNIGTVLGLCTQIVKHELDQNFLSTLFLVEAVKASVLRIHPLITSVYLCET